MTRAALTLTALAGALCGCGPEAGVVLLFEAKGLVCPAGPDVFGFSLSAGPLEALEGQPAQRVFAAPEARCGTLGHFALGPAGTDGVVLAVRAAFAVDGGVGSLCFGPQVDARDCVVVRRQVPVPRGVLTRLEVVFDGECRNRLCTADSTCQARDCLSARAALPDCAQDADCRRLALVDAGPDLTEKLVLRVVGAPATTRTLVPLSGVEVRAEDPGGVADGITDDAGVVVLSRRRRPSEPGRPLAITAARRDRGIVSVVGIQGDVPSVLRLDNPRLDPARYLPLRYTAERQQQFGATVASTWGSSEVTRPRDFLFPRAFAAGVVPWLVVLEQDQGQRTQAWGRLEVRDAGQDSPDGLRISLGPATVRPVSVTLAVPDEGPTANVPDVADLRVEVADREWPEESLLVVALRRGPARFTDTVFVPLEADGGPVAGADRFRARLEWVPSGLSLLQVRPFDGGSVVVAAPQVAELGLEGRTLAALGRTRVSLSPPLPQLRLTVQDVAGPTSWRVYTAPGAPASIAALPSLPLGKTAQELGLGPLLDVRLAAGRPSGAPWHLEHRQPVALDAGLVDVDDQVEVRHGLVSRQ